MSNYGIKYVMAKRIQRNLRRYAKKNKFRKKYRNKRARVSKSQFNRLKNIALNNQDFRWKDTVQSNLSADANGNIYSNFCGLESIDQGDDVSQRSGNKIVLKKIMLKGQIRVADSDAFNSMRIVIFCLPDTPTITPQVDSILQTGELYSFYRKDSDLVYKILFDKTWTLGSLKQQVTTLTGTLDINQGAIPAFRNFEITLSFGPKGKKLWYRGPGVGRPTKNSLYMILVSDSTDGLITGHPTLSMNTRCSWLA